jgi:tetratricopeptide (TPR) repeat protein
METPSPDDVRAQVERLHRQCFRGVKAKRLLSFLVEEWLAGRAEKLTLEYIGESLKDEPRTFEEDSDRWSYPKTRGNLAHVRTRMMGYYETEGYLDPIIIKLNKGSYMPVIAYNTAVTDVARLDPKSERLMLRAKTALDARTLRGVMRALDYFVQLMEIPFTNPRQTSTLIFIPMVIAPIMPNATKAIRPHVESVLSKTRAAGLEPWECTFADACSSACYRHDWKKSLALFETAIINSHGEAAYFWWYTALLASQGRLAEAIDKLDAEVRHFSRTSIAARTDLALLQIMARRYGDAEEILSSSLDFTTADNPLIACHFAMLYETQDRLKEAVQSMTKWLHRAEEAGLKNVPLEEALKVDLHSFIVGMAVLVIGRGGNVDLATKLLNQLVRRKVRFDRTSSVEIAVGMVGLDRHDEAVEWLKKAAFEEGDPYSMWFHVFPPLRHLHAHEGFRKLLGRLKLPLQRIR